MSTWLQVLVVSVCSYVALSTFYGWFMARTMVKAASGQMRESALDRMMLNRLKVDDEQLAKAQDRWSETLNDMHVTFLELWFICAVRWPVIVAFAIAHWNDLE